MKAVTDTICLPYTFDEDILKFDSAVADKTDVSHLTRSDLGLAEGYLGAKA